MDDLISRSAAIDAAIDGADDWDGGYSPERERCIRKRMALLPAVDAVPVVRCEDCIYWKSDMLTHFWKPCDVVSTDKDWYCPCGKRR